MKKNSRNAMLVCLAMLVSCLALVSIPTACHRGTFEEQRAAAEARIGVGDAMGAVKAYRSLIRQYATDDRRAELLLRIGDIESSVMDDPQAAMASYSEAIAAVPLSAAAQIARERRASLREERGEFNGAIEDYSVLLKYAVDAATSYRYRILLSGVYLSSGDYRQARVELKQMIEDAKTPSEFREKAYFLAGESFFLEGKTQRAAEYYQALLNEFPKSVLAPEAKLHLASCLEELGYLGPAREVTKGAAKDYPNKDVVNARLKSIDERGSMPPSPTGKKAGTPETAQGKKGLQKKTP